MKPFRTITLIILDGVGIGAAPDASGYGDVGADTIGHLAEYRRLKIKNLSRLGFGNIRKLAGIESAANPLGYYGYMNERSKGKGSTEGHWEIAGCLTEEPFAVFPSGFPEEVITKFSKAIGRDILGNYPASGTDIINRYGDEHYATGKPIVYTSADSVFQIAASEEIVLLEQLYKWCETARAMLTGQWKVVRVIARPFIKQGKTYIRTTNRRDFSVEPPSDTILDILKKNKINTLGIGKIEDLFAGRGLTESIKTHGNEEGMVITIQKTAILDRGLIMTNLIDFDTLYGHRNDADGFIKALEKFDLQLGELIEKMQTDQLLIITADHGCDPLFKGWDHTRESVPLIAYSPIFKSGGDLGRRDTFADIAATIAENFQVQSTGVGRSFFTAFN